MTDTDTKITLPKLDWKTATCEVCGKPFQYFGRVRPHTCKDGDCRYKYQHRIDPDRWASYQPTLFDSKK